MILPLFFSLDSYLKEIEFMNKALLTITFLYTLQSFIHMAEYWVTKPLTIEQLNEVNIGETLDVGVWGYNGYVSSLGESFEKTGNDSWLYVDLKKDTFKHVNNSYVKNYILKLYKSLTHPPYQLRIAITKRGGNALFENREIPNSWKTLNGYCTKVPKLNVKKMF